MGLKRIWVVLNMTVMDMTERFKKLKKFHNAVQLEIHDNQGQYPELCF